MVEGPPRENATESNERRQELLRELKTLVEEILADQSIQFDPRTNRIKRKVFEVTPLLNMIIQWQQADANGRPRSEIRFEQLPDPERLEQAIKRREIISEPELVKVYYHYIGISEENGGDLSIYSWRKKHPLADQIMQGTLSKEPGPLLWDMSKAFKTEWEDNIQYDEEKLQSLLDFIKGFNT